MPYAKNTSVKETKPVHISDLGDDDEILPDDKPEGPVGEEADGEEAALSEDEELDPTELNPFGDKWEV